MHAVSEWLLPCANLITVTLGAEVLRARQYPGRAALSQADSDKQIMGKLFKQLLKLCQCEDVDARPLLGKVVT